MGWLVAYDKQSWESAPSANTPITHDRLNHMEDGIESAATTADSALSAAQEALAGTGVLFARKTADTSRASNIVDTADPHLTLPVAASTVYIVEGFLRYEGSPTGDLRVRLIGPSGSSVQMMFLGPGVGVSSTTSTLNTTVDAGVANIGAVNVGTDQGLLFTGALVVGAAAGDAYISWAQNVSDVAATTLFTNSWIRLTPAA